MSDQLSLGGILDDKAPPPERTPEPAAPAEPAQTAPVEPSTPAEPAPERPRGPDGKFLSKEAIAQAEGKQPAQPKADAQQKPAEKPAAAPHQEPELTPRERAFLARAQDETRKRQTLEQWKMQQEAQLQAQQAAKPQEPPKQFWDDPEGALHKQMQDVQTMVVNTRLNTAEAISRSRHPDFEEKVAVFAQILQSTPGLHQQWLSAPDPAEFAYSLAKNRMELAQVGNMDNFRAQVEKETRLKMEAEYKERADAAAKARAALPGSLTDAHSTGANKVAWGGPSTLSSILDGK